MEGMLFLPDGDIRAGFIEKTTLKDLTVVDRGEFLNDLVMSHEGLGNDLEASVFTGDVCDKLIQSESDAFKDAFRRGCDAGRRMVAEAYLAMGKGLDERLRAKLDGCQGRVKIIGAPFDVVYASSVELEG